MEHDFNGNPIPDIEADNKILQEEKEFIAQQEPEENIEPEAIQEEEVKEEVKVKTEEPAAKSFRELREKFERSEKEKQELLNYLMEQQRIQQEQQRNKSLEVAVKPEPDYDLDDDALVEGKHYKSMRKDIKELREDNLRLRKQTEQQILEAKLKAKFPDYDEVVSKENLDLLAQDSPELIDSIRYNPEPFSQAVSAYKILKREGIAKEKPVRNIEKEQISRNLNKPRVVNSIAPQKGEGPLSSVNNFDDFENEEERAKRFRLINELAGR